MKSMLKIIQEEKWFLLVMFLSALMIRLVYFDIFLRDNPCMLMFDSGQYHELATQIADGHGFSKPDGSPQFYRLPGYSLFLALSYKIFDNNLLITLLIQILLASIIPLFIFFLSLRLFPHDLRAAKIAAVISCVYHGLIIYSGLVMSETLFMLFFLLFLLMFFKIQSKSSFSHAVRPDGGPKVRMEGCDGAVIVCAGMLLGCVSMVRSVGLVLLLVCFIVIVCMKISCRQKFLHMLLLCAGWLLILSFWLARNYMHTGHIFLDTLSGAHLLNHQAVPVLMKAENITHTQAKEKVYALFEAQKHAQEIIKKRPLQEIELAHIANTITIGLGKKYPYVTCKHTIFNMFKTCCSLYAAELLVIDSAGKLPDYDNNRGIGSMIKRFLMPDVSNKLIGYVIFYELILYFFIVIGFLGALMVIRDHNFINFFCTHIIWFILALLGITFACGFARLRLPLSPFFIIVTSRFWSLIMKKRVTRE